MSSFRGSSPSAPASGGFPHRQVCQTANRQGPRENCISFRHMLSRSADKNPAALNLHRCRHVAQNQDPNTVSRHRKIGEWIRQPLRRRLTRDPPDASIRRKRGPAFVDSTFVRIADHRPTGQINATPSGEISFQVASRNGFFRWRHAAFSVLRGGHPP